MKKILFLLALMPILLATQKATYDLTTYSPPKSWNKEVKANSYTSYTITNKQVAASSDFKMGYGKPCISCNLPAGTKFNTVYWKNTTTDSDNVNVYISNVRITKE